MSLQLASDSSASSSSETIGNASNRSRFGWRPHPLSEQFLKSSLLLKPMQQRLRALPSRRRDRLDRPPTVISSALVRAKARGMWGMSLQNSKKIEAFAELNSNS